MVPVIDESQLTAYALGELTGTERAAVAAYLAGSAAGRQYVADVRATANLLVDELARESFGGLTDLQHAAIEQQLDDAMRMPVVRGRNHRRRNWNLTVFGMSLAASVLIVCGIIYLVVPMVYSRVATALHEQQERDAQALREQQEREERSGDNFKIPFRMVKPPRLDPGLAVKPPEKPALSRVESAVADNVDTFAPDETFTIPQPDAHMPPSEPERDEAPRLVNIQPRDNAAPKPSVHIVRPGDRSTDTTSGTVAPLKSKSDAFAKFVTNEHSSAKEHGTEVYPPLAENRFVSTATEPVSGFSAGVDTASYSNIRRFLTHDRRPPTNAVRIEEMLNYFPVHAPPASPSAGEGPLVMQVEVGACPWRPEHRLARICLQARELPAFSRPPVNLVFVVDVSDRMRAEQSKLPLLKHAMKRVVGKLTARDRISIVSYSQEAVTVLAPTDGSDKITILSAIDRLEFAGHSAGGQGIEIAYDLAVRGFIPGGVNRLILASDGNWNVGRTDFDQLPSIVRDQTRNNISLTVLGVGMNTLKDAKLQNLAIAGNGSYAYIDTFDEARKVLTDQVGGALVAVARDVKVQITFNPAVALDYRLIGYERRVLSKGEIRSESTRGGELGAGQSVTALYEVTPVTPAPKSPAARPADMLTATVTYVDPATLAPHSLQTSSEDRATPVPRTSVEFRFAAAVAEFGLLLRNSDYKGNATWSGLVDHAREATGPDDTRYREEFFKLVQKAKALPPTAR